MVLMLLSMPVLVVVVLVDGICLLLPLARAYLVDDLWCNVALVLLAHYSQRGVSQSVSQSVSVSGGDGDGDGGGREY